MARVRYCYHGFATIEEARQFKKRHGGVLLREQRSKDRYEIECYRMEGLSRSLPYVVAWNEWTEDE